jgi:hypothetical protein
MKKISSTQILKVLLLIAAGYFFCVAAAHLAGLKIPGLFIYFDLASDRYQDLLISLLSFGWAVFFCLGYILIGKGLTKYIFFHILAGAYGIFALSLINLSNRSGNQSAHWLADIIAFVYLLLLTTAYLGSLTRPALNK